jgi:iron complex transport system permease protein
MSQPAQISESHDLNAEALFSAAPRLALLVLLGIALAIVAGWALALGIYRMSWGDVWTVLVAHLVPFGDGAAVNRLHDTVVWQIRLPRILMALVVGGGLAAAGTVFQGCFRNPLVEPYILGVSSGAAFGAAIGIVYPWFALSSQVSAFVFAVGAVTVVYALARVRGETPVVTMILGGVIVGSVFSAGVSILKYLASDAALREIVFWLMGGFYYATWRDVAVTAPVVVLAVAGMSAGGWVLNVLSMGDQEARTLGVNPERARMVLAGLATLVTALSVSSVGVVAWVGLMMPHAARLVVGPDNRFVVPSAALLGGMYLVICDTLARTLTVSEIPVGIITSLAGAPYLAYLLRSKARAMYS